MTNAERIAERAARPRDEVRIVASDKEVIDDWARKLKVSPESMLDLIVEKGMDAMLDIYDDGELD